VASQSISRHQDLACLRGDAGVLIEGSEVQSMDSDSDTPDIAENPTIANSTENGHNLKLKHPYYAGRQINDFSRQYL